MPDSSRVSCSAATLAHEGLSLVRRMWVDKKIPQCCGRCCRNIFFALIATVFIRDWNQGIVVPRDFLGVFFLLGWFGSAQILVSSFSSYDLWTWRWKSESLLALVIVSGVALMYAALRPFILESLPALQFGTSAVLGMIPGIVLYFFFRKLERQYARNGAYTSLKDDTTRTACVLRQPAKQTLVPSRAQLDVIRWHHALIAVFFFPFAPAWGAVKLMRGERRSGLFLIIAPVIFLACYAILILIAIQVRR
jgi:hypothetical protein